MEDFKRHCESLGEMFKSSKVTEGEAQFLAEALVSTIKTYFGHDWPSERCWPLVVLLDDFCAVRTRFCSLPAELQKQLLRELMRNLYSNAWTKQLNTGEALLKKLNLACVMFMQGLERHRACSLLLELGMDEGDVVGSTLAVKSLKKISKTFATSKAPEQDAREVLAAVHSWLQRAPVGGSAAAESAFRVVLEGAQTAAEAAREASPAAARAWLALNLSRSQVGGSSLLCEWLSAEVASDEKENVGGSGAGSLEGRRSMPEAGQVGEPPLRKSAPTMPGPNASPCHSRNARP